jgi:hypothetical protein
MRGRRSKRDVVVRRRWGVEVRRFGAAFGVVPVTATALPREFGLECGEQHAFFLVPARLAGIVERSAAAVDVELRS